MRSFILSIATLAVCLPLFGQDGHCAYRATEEDRQKIRELEKLAAENPQRIYEDNTIKIAMYRLRHDDGSGALSDSAFAEEINNLNSYYDLHDICFSLVRIENIDNSAYLDAAIWNTNNGPDSLKSAIKSENQAFGDALTIYVLPPEIWYRGSSYGIPSTAVLMSSHPNRWGRSHIAHELGHCLGNFHTHDDIGGGRLELVTRTFQLFQPLLNGQGAWWDCYQGADGFCDTQADPNLGDTTSWGAPRVDAATCTFQDTALTDFYGDTYHPDTDNIMSYSPMECRQVFSGLQVGRMHLTLDLNLDFSNKQAPNTKQLNGQTIINGHKHVLTKSSITVANNNPYEVLTFGEVIHESQGVITLHPGFRAAPTHPDGFYVARVKDLCNNSTEIDYSMH